jgi:predicted anti-sigma-YlaC factor YlaD
MRTICDHVRAIIQRQMDGDAIAQRDAQSVEAHLAACAACRSFTHDLTRIVGLVERLPAVAAPPGMAVRVIEQATAPSPERRPQAWLWRMGHAWTLWAGVAGFAILLYQMGTRRGLSLLNLHKAISEWLSLIDLSNLGSLLQATSLLSWSVGVELLLGMSLLLVALFGIMAQAITRPPTLGAARRL